MDERSTVKEERRLERRAEEPREAREPHEQAGAALRPASPRLGAARYEHRADGEVPERERPAQVLPRHELGPHSEADPAEEKRQPEQAHPSAERGRERLLRRGRSWR